MPSPKPQPQRQPAQPPAPPPEPAQSQAFADDAADVILDMLDQLISRFSNRPLLALTLSMVRAAISNLIGRDATTSGQAMADARGVMRDYLPTLRKNAAGGDSNAGAEALEALDVLYTVEYALASAGDPPWEDPLPAGSASDWMPGGEEEPEPEPEPEPAPQPQPAARPSRAERRDQRRVNRGK